MQNKRPLENIVRQALKSKGVSVAELAREAGVSRVTIYHLFKGIYSQKLLRRVSQALSVPFPVLLLANHQDASGSDHELLRSYYSSDLSIRRAVDTMLRLKPKEAPSLPKPRVFVVDDMTDNVELLARVLRKDFDVTAFTDPKAALEAMADSDVDAVVSDQRMPRMNGTSLLREVGSLSRKIVKVIVSAYSDNEAMLSAINDAHVDAFFVKPFAPRELRQRLLSLLDRTTSQPQVH